MYAQVCSRCHSLELFKLADLKQLGYAKSQILRLANGGRVSRRFKLPYASKAQAKAFNSGIIPPDLSLVAKRNNVGYIRGVLLGYTRERANATAPRYYNYGFDSGVTLMPPVLASGAVRYASGAVRAHLVQYVLDVSEFLT